LPRRRIRPLNGSLEVLHGLLVLVTVLCGVESDDQRTPGGTGHPDGRSGDLDGLAIRAQALPDKLGRRREQM
jgi:hypothetical protein